jgi:hypothetical protein
MAYRNKTFVSFASEDLTSYRLMTAWRANQKIAFDFFDAHDINIALDSSQPETIRRRLRERLANTKQVVLLVGSKTRSVASSPGRFLYYEIETIRKLEFPVIIANLNGSRVVEEPLMPTALVADYTLSVSFQPTIIKYALDNWVEAFPQERATKTGPHQYNASLYHQLGL